LSPVLYNFFISFNAYRLLKCSYHSSITTAPARRPSHSITGHKTPAHILFSHSPCNTINKRTSKASTRIPTSLQFQENAEIAFIRRSRSNQQRPHFHIPRHQTLTIPPLTLSERARCDSWTAGTCPNTICTNHYRRRVHRLCITSPYPLHAL